MAQTSRGNEGKTWGGERDLPAEFFFYLAQREGPKRIWKSGCRSWENLRVFLLPISLHFKICFLESPPRHSLPIFILNWILSNEIYPSLRNWNNRNFWEGDQVHQPPMKQSLHSHKKSENSYLQDQDVIHCQLIRLRCEHREMQHVHGVQRNKMHRKWESNAWENVNWSRRRSTVN